MTLPTSNLSFSAIQTEFGGSNPISLSEYYKSGTYVRANSTGSIPTSGAISLSQFLGATQGVLYPVAGTVLSQGCVANGVAPYTYRVTKANGSGGSYNEDTNNSPTCGYVAPPVYGTILSQGCVAYGTAPYTYRVTKANGSGGSFNEDTPNSPSCGYVAPPAAGTILSQGCVAYGTAPYTYRVTRADGSGSSYNEDTPNSTTCGYVAPVPPSSATWSIGYSNSGSAGAISVFVLVTLNRPATVSTTFTFTGVVVQNGVAFSVPSVTIPVGSTSANPSSFSGVTNGSGPYVPITLRATPSSVPYTLTPSGSIDTTFQYSA
jgi:hypothetical protein